VKLMQRGRFQDAVAVREFERAAQMDSLNTVAAEYLRALRSRTGSRER
jgi:hypothetical protein